MVMSVICERAAGRGLRSDALVATSEKGLGCSVVVWCDK